MTLSVMNNPSTYRPSGPHAWLLRAASTLVDVSCLPPALPADIREAWHVALAATAVTASALAAAAAKTLKVSPAAETTPEASLLRLVPEALARRFAALPVAMHGDAIVLACADPFNLDAEQGLAFVTGRRVELVPMAPDTVEELLDVAYSPERAVDAVADSIGVDASGIQIEEDLQPSETEVEDPTGAVRRLAASLLRDAVIQAASDIHMAPTGSVGEVRYRLDGIMKRVLTMPLPVYRRVVSRLKVIGGLDISDTRRPQDGRSRIVVEGHGIDLRISSLPLEVGGERLVIRLLSHTSIQSLDALDLVEPKRSQLLRLMDLADGLVLMTGPTGSGKTTTLHAALQRRLSPDVTIMTVENPVEYRIPGISQVQVDVKAGLTFASALRAMLRQDPDIVLVGEIRDEETAETAAQAAMTGHLVLSTVHTEDAPGALIRLRDLGLKLDTMTETFKGAVAQRLLRKLCESCRAPGVPATPSEDERRFAALPGQRIGAHAVGCERCNFTGYRGRLPIHQVFTMTDNVKHLVLREADPEQVREAARTDGMRSLAESAATRIASGETTVEESLRVLGRRFWDELGSAVVPPPAPEPVAAAPAGVRPDSAPSAEATMPIAAADLAALAARTAVRQDAVVVYSRDDALRARLQTLAASTGLTVFACASTADVARIVREGRDGVRLLVLDIAGTLDRGSDGAGSLRELRRALGGLTLPVLAVGDIPDTGATATTMPMLLDDLVPLPLDDQRFVRRLQAALRRHAAVA